MTHHGVNRRDLLRIGAAGGAVAGVGAALPLLLAGADTTTSPTAHAGMHQAASNGEHDAHLSSTVGDVDIARLRWDPSDFVTTFDYGETTTMRQTGVELR